MAQELVAHTPAKAGGSNLVPILATSVRLLAEIPAAILVVAEIGILFAGVLARYVFQAPLVWSDELASILFLWLAMLGSVIALQRGEHMRLTAVVARLSPTGQARAAALASAAVAAFLLMVVPAGWDYAAEQWFIQTPALNMHDTFRAAAIPVGRAADARHRPHPTGATALARGRIRRRHHRPARSCAARRGPCADASRQLEPGAVLRRVARHRRAAVSADRFRVRARDARVPRDTHAYAAFGRNLPHG